MPFILHDGHLSPFVRFDLIFLDRVESLLATKPSKHIDIASAHRDCMRVSTFVHWALVSDLILYGSIEASIFLGR